MRWNIFKWYPLLLFLVSLSHWISYIQDRSIRFKIIKHKNWVYKGNLTVFSVIHKPRLQKKIVVAIVAQYITEKTSARELKPFYLFCYSSAWHLTIFFSNSLWNKSFLTTNWGCNYLCYHKQIHLKKNLFQKVPNRCDSMHAKRNRFAQKIATLQF